MEVRVAQPKRKAEFPVDPQFKADAMDAMRHPSTRRMLVRILNTTGLREDAFHPDPYVHAYVAGMRSIGVELERALVLSDPHGYATLLAENLQNALDAVKGTAESDDFEDDGEQ